MEQFPVRELSDPLHVRAAGWCPGVVGGRSASTESPAVYLVGGAAAPFLWQAGVAPVVGSVKVFSGRVRGVVPAVEGGWVVDSHVLTFEAVVGPVASLRWLELEGLGSRTRLV